MMRTFLLCLVVLSVGVREAQAARIEYTGSFGSLEFHVDGSCPFIDLQCAADYELRSLLNFPKFDHSLGELESVSIEYLYLFNVQGDYNVIESTAESPPTVGGRAATECVGLPVGSICHVDYGVFSQAFTDEFSDESSFSGPGTTWAYADLEGGVGAWWHLGEKGDFDFAFLEGTAASVTYTYTPVPEPSTALLLGFGIVGLATVRRPS